MRMTFLSDTHNQHSLINMGSQDIIVHCGDATGMGRSDELKKFIEWFTDQDARHLIFVPGNHEVGLEGNYEKRIQWFKDAGIIVLNDESVTIEDTSIIDFTEYKVKIHGSPFTPNFGNWSFMKPRGEQINKHWMKIPLDADVVITHGPPHRILDAVDYGSSVNYAGCEMLADRIRQVKPKIHAFGHIHEGAGTYIEDGIEYINASQVDEHYVLRHQPIEREW